MEPHSTDYTSRAEQLQAKAQKLQDQIYELASKIQAITENPSPAFFVNDAMAAQQQAKQEADLARAQTQKALEETIQRVASLLGIDRHYETIVALKGKESEHYKMDPYAWSCVHDRIIGIVSDEETALQFVSNEEEFEALTQVVNGEISRYQSIMARLYPSSYKAEFDLIPYQHYQYHHKDGSSNHNEEEEIGARKGVDHTLWVVDESERVPEHEKQDDAIATIQARKTLSEKQDVGEVVQFSKEIEQKLKDKQKVNTTNADETSVTRMATTTTTTTTSSEITTTNDTTIANSLLSKEDSKKRQVEIYKMLCEGKDRLFSFAELAEFEPIDTICTFYYCYSMNKHLHSVKSLDKTDQTVVDMITSGYAQILKSICKNKTSSKDERSWAVASRGNLLGAIQGVTMRYPFDVCSLLVMLEEFCKQYCLAIVKKDSSSALPRLHSVDKKTLQGIARSAVIYDFKISQQVEWTHKSSSPNDGKLELPPNVRTWISIVVKDFCSKKDKAETEMRAIVHKEVHLAVEKMIQEWELESSWPLQANRMDELSNRLVIRLLHLYAAYAYCFHLEGTAWMLTLLFIKYNRGDFYYHMKQVLSKILRAMHPVIRVLRSEDSAFAQIKTKSTWYVSYFVLVESLMNIERHAMSLVDDLSDSTSNHADDIACIDMILSGDPDKEAESLASRSCIQSTREAHKAISTDYQDLIEKLQTAGKIDFVGMSKKFRMPKQTLYYAQMLAFIEDYTKQLSQ
jgi:hypothetical protein